MLYRCSILDRYYLFLILSVDMDIFYGLVAVYLNLVLDKLLPILQENDVVAILSNDGFDNIHARVLEKLQAI